MKAQVTKTKKEKRKESKAFLNLSTDLVKRKIERFVDPSTIYHAILKS